MEFINLSGYIESEKLQIARKYLCPRAAKDSGLSNEHLDISDAALMYLIRWYCRESGVRNLQKTIEKVYRKASLNFVRMLPLIILSFFIFTLII